MKKSLKPAVSDFIQDRISLVCVLSEFSWCLRSSLFFSGGRLHLSTLVLIPKVHVKTVQKGKSILWGGGGSPSSLGLAIRNVQEGSLQRTRERASWRRDQESSLT